MTAWMILLAVASFAGDSKGNGGHVVVCREPRTNAIQHLELLDFYEAREIRGIERELGGTRTPDKIAVALGRLARLDKPRAEAYAARAAKFESEALIKKGVKLRLIDDSFHLALPAHCRIEQLAIQIEPVFPEDRRYLVNGDYWELLDADNRAGLILHEVIYAEALRLGHTDSRAARYFNSYLTSKKIEAITPEGYPDFLRLIRFRAD